MRKKILFIDLDGTTLRDDKSLPPENKTAIFEALDAGHIVAANTGRGIHSTMLLMNEFGIAHENFYLLCFQGNLIYHPATEKILYSAGISREDGIERLKDLEAHGIHAHTYGSEGILSVHDNESLREYMRITNEKTVFIESWDALKEPVIPKIIAIDYKDHDKLEEYRRYFMSLNDDRFECFFSAPVYLEFTKKGTDKGLGVREFVKLFGMDISDTVGVGDEENDIPLIKTVGVGVAVKNAVPATLECADYVTEHDNNNGAVAEVIKKFVL